MYNENLTCSRVEQTDVPKVHKIPITEKVKKVKARTKCKKKKKALQIKCMSESFSSSSRAISNFAYTGTKYNHSPFTATHVLAYTRALSSNLQWYIHTREQKEREPIRALSPQREEHRNPPSIQLRA